MNYLAPVGRLIGNLKGFYSGINGATLTGAIDVIVVEQEDGTFKCSPFHVRFGKLGVLRSKEKVVDIEVNEVPVKIRMKLGDSGEAFFVQEIDSEDEIEDENLATSPIPGSPYSAPFADGDTSGGSKGSTETSPLKEAVVIPIEDDIDSKGQVLPPPGNPPSNLHPSSSTPNLQNSDGRKRRKKRKRNQGSRSDIKVEPMEGGEREIFQLDEDLSIASDALNARDFDEEGKLHHSRSFHRDFFSDTEIDPTGTPPNSRPSTPIQSDSEYETSKVHTEGAVEDDEVSKWVWGELPSTGNTTPTLSPVGFPLTGPNGRRTPAKRRADNNAASSDDENSKDSSNKSMLANMFSFMARGKQNSTEPGIYLDDLNVENLDPEMAALYLPDYRREKKDEDDGESGKGSSLPQSPQPGSSPKQSHMHGVLAFEDRKRNESSSSDSDLASKFEGISLCGNSLNLFDQSQLSYDELVENPEILLNTPPESIVVKMEGKFIPWTAALPQLLSTTFFRRPLPPHVYEKLIEQSAQIDVKREESSPPHGAPSASEPVNASTSSEDGPRGRTYSWFPWRRSQTSQDQIGAGVKDSPLRSKALQVASVTSSSDESEGTGGHESGTRKNANQSLPITIQDVLGEKEKFKKSLRLTSDQIKDLGLHYGRNEAVFSVTTAYQGTTNARCHIYLWKYDDRVVVSDIDGTITKSDVLGHILPIIGNDWSQSGVAQLFTQINANGYKMLYLSARAIGQAQVTREYLRSIRQGDVTLPDGPLLLNPTSLMAAFHREVIEKKPEEFKIACLKDIQTLFPRNPFYAGYGNRINDVWSYRAVDINISRVFTINHKGELRHALTNTFQSSYTSLVELAEHIFPPYKGTSFCEMDADGYGSFEFWREPLVLIGTGVDKTDGHPGFFKGRPRANTIV